VGAIAMSWAKEKYPRLLDYDDSLCARMYDDYFKRVISCDMWGKIQNQAKINLKKSKNMAAVSHWEKFVSDKLPINFEIKK
jgi:hypothetical protein